MILSTFKSNRGYTNICKCDRCGKQFNNPVSNTKKVQYCSADCYTNKGACMVCGKIRDTSFYDKSEHRPLCSRACYSAYCDSRPNNDIVHKDYDKEIKYKVKADYKYYKQGHLVLIDFNLSSIF